MQFICKQWCGNFLKNYCNFSIISNLKPKEKLSFFPQLYQSFVFLMHFFSKKYMQFKCKQWCGNFLKSSCIIFLLYQVWKSSKNPSQNWMALYNLYHCASIRVIFAKFVPTKEIWYLSDCVTLEYTGQIQFTEGWKYILPKFNIVTGH